MILKSTAQQLQLTGKQDSILLTTISQESVHCSGQSVKLQISSADQPATRFDIDNAFTADNLCMSEYTYPIENMQQHWTHLENLPLPKINGAVPSILIGSDNSKLILPKEPVCFGNSDAPSGVHTNLGWTVQGPSMMLGQTKRNTCLLNQTRPAELSPSHCVERLWQLDTLPFTSKQVIRSKQDKMALEILDSQTTRIEVDGVLYSSQGFDPDDSTTQLHIFCDASERVYGSVAYLRSEDRHGRVHVSFVMSRSKVAPKRQLTIPRLELCAALTGAQLADLLQCEIKLPIQATYLWSDSTTVLTWLQSESCRYKVFVGARVAEIQNLTDTHCWRYVNTQQNPADDITRGLSVKDLVEESRWRNGPAFLRQSADEWPESPSTGSDEPAELRKSAMLSTIVTQTPTLPDPTQYESWEVFISDVNEALDGAAPKEETKTLTPEHVEQTENYLYCQVQQQCFSKDFDCLKSGKQLPHDSRLIQLDPEYDPELDLIRVGGRLRRAESLDSNIKNPIVLDPTHEITKLIIRDHDEKLLHYGPEHLFAEIRRRFWVLRGREAIRRHQRKCATCQKWRSNPATQKMADLPPARLRLFKPAFYSTGVDCFGPMQVKIGRRLEKRWGVIFKCMTTRAVHLDLLESMDSDAFLMAFRRFVSRRGKPHELLSDQGTNFKGAKSELQNAWSEMEPELRHYLVNQKVEFVFNPPSAPHHGGVWEREIRSVKHGLRVSLGQQTVTEATLRTVLCEVEGILNSKPLSYVSSDARDLDPITPNILLMGRHDTSLPQVVYPAETIRGLWPNSSLCQNVQWTQMTLDLLFQFLGTIPERSKDFSYFKFNA
ncbi:uncharacterized protein LOC124275671 [Haliotis rubra]|uniref:uncharacterized protein LOC124275671 n=1 Tax=Haliotis rubra TaxID=36100 RepID=UPI001EE61303|nr:uncharacterized protein LOC124275671 [Haliotis rubra]